MIRIVSFSYEHGTPPKDALVFDCRRLPNPQHVPELKPLDGTAYELKLWLTANASKAMADMLSQAVEHAQAGRDVAFGCFGGRHRSVACAEMTAAVLWSRGHEVQVQHTALTKEG
jgi:UPF0042 nucleotide-binding protein